MKIIIVGAGISGLSIILLVEAYDTSKIVSAPKLSTGNGQVQSINSSPPAAAIPQSDPGSTTTEFAAVVVGSALGLSKNGLNVLKRMHPDGSTKTFDSICKRGHIITKWSIGNSRGWHMAEMVLISDEIKNKNNQPENLDTELGPGLIIVRQALWECLRDAVLEAGGKVVTKRMKSIILNEDAGHPVTVHFTDGDTESADLVIGADGLKSTVRKVIFEKEKEDYITPHYEGLSGIGGWMPSSVLESTSLKQGVMSVTFGPNGFFGCGHMGPSSLGPAAGWWSTYPCPTPPPPTSTTNPFDKKAAKAKLLARHANWKDPAVRAIINHIASTSDDEENEGDGLIAAEYPTYTTPLLPRYANPSGQLVLLGDAAHALQPSSGQGAGQALEDAESYALLLRHYYLQSSSQAESQSQTSIVASTLSATGRAYTELRKPRITKIHVQAQRTGGMKKEIGIIGELLLYVFFKLITLFAKDTFNRELMLYDVPAEVDRYVDSHPLPQ